MILHIPHSSIKISEDVHIPNLEDSINLMTDWYADELFQLSTATRVVQDLSRLVVDVERLPNDAMEMYGKGKIYTSDVFGYPIIRDKDISHYENIYNNYHKWFNATVAGYLSYFPAVVVVDCHAYNKKPLNWENSGHRPDICIGTNFDHYPIGLIDQIAKFFMSKGLSIGYNTPYSGAIIPSRFVSNPNVYCVMIEVKKSLYINNVYEKRDGFFDILQSVITEALGLIDEWETKKDNEFWKNL
jgi:N-formylglutamate deformylase